MERWVPRLFIPVEVSLCQFVKLRRIIIIIKRVHFHNYGIYIVQGLYTGCSMTQCNRVSVSMNSQGRPSALHLLVV